MPVFVEWKSDPPKRIPQMKDPEEKVCLRPLRDNFPLSRVLGISPSFLAVSPLFSSKANTLDRSGKS
jgi:hypothetical protein